MADMIDLVARRAPELMKRGGGAVSSDYEGRYKTSRILAYTEAEKKRMIEMAKSGNFSAVDIGRELGRNPTRIRNILKESGITIGDFRRRYTDEQREQIAAMASAGICCSRIAKQFGRSNDQIARIVREMGIQPVDGRKVAA
jgi:transposase-like protein